ncbi:hypothetical protein [Clostridium tyrobutyricum]|uniref:hypothetical protein n=1 Tax=Clostridium tyrobutyricum TaxID=1519 RepID=UPI0005802B00|nr:hypothetical protein [Clostridium tyrobutyricum]
MNNKYDSVQEKNTIPDDFFYIVKVNIDISGCELDFEILDKEILQSISCKDCEIKNIDFKYKIKGKSVFECRIYTKNLLKTYNFVDYELRPLIIKTLLLTKNVKGLLVDTNIKYTIENQKEAKERNISIIPYSGKYLQLVVKPSKVEENEFRNAVKEVSKNSLKFEDSLFWMCVSYSIIGESDSMDKFDFISQYSILWTAFNSFYSKIYPDKSDRTSVKAIASKKYVIEYFNKLLNSYDTYELLKKLSCEKLVLRGNDDVSEKLKKSLKDKDYEQIALNAVLCLYAVRNAIVHGDVKQELDLCRLAFKILNPLLKLSIINEINL